MKGKFPCPKCGKNIDLSLEDILKGQDLSCPHCKVSIKIKESDMKSLIESKIPKR